MFVVFMLIQGEKNRSVTILVLIGTENSAVDFFATCTLLCGTNWCKVIKFSKNALFATSIVVPMLIKASYLVLFGTKNSALYFFATSRTI